MKKPSRFVVILYGACAVIWTARAVLEVVYQTYYDSVFWFVLNILCALLWIGAFFVSLRRYRFNKSE